MRACPSAALSEDYLLTVSPKVQSKRHSRFDKVLSPLSHFYIFRRQYAKSEHCRSISTAIAGPCPTHGRAFFQRLSPRKICRKDTESWTRYVTWCQNHCFALESRRPACWPIRSMQLLHTHTSTPLIARAVVQPITPVEQHILEQFDFDSKFGPCTGMTRLERNVPLRFN